MDCIPEWTEKVERIGLDPLGLQNSGVALYQALLPAIGNATPRLRYYGLYCWLSETYARELGDTDPVTWRRWVRRCEALYALAAVAHGNENGVAGVEWANGLLKGAGQAIDLGPGTEVTGEGLYLKQRLGVFGAAYGSQIVTMGLMQENENFRLPVATRDRGRPLAEQFGRAVGNAGRSRILETIGTGIVSRDALEALFPILPSAIDPASDEADAYRRLLFAEDSGAEDGVARRRSLMLVLRVAAGLGRLPTPDDIRWRLFDPAGWGLPEALEAHRLRWEAYQAHDILQLALAGLLRWSLDRLGDEDGRLTMADLVEDSAASLLQAADLDPASSWRDMVAAHADQGGSRAMVGDIAAVRHDGRLPPQTAAEALRLIATLQARVQARPDLAGELTRSFSLDLRARSIRSELHFLEAMLDRPLGEVARALFDERVLRRHYWVALLKLRNRDYTFLFDAQDGRLRKRATYTPVLTTPRLGPALNFLKDIGLLDASGLNERGRPLAEAAA